MLNVETGAIKRCLRRSATQELVLMKLNDGDAACTRVNEEGKETEAVALLAVGRLKDEAMN